MKRNNDKLRRPTSVYQTDRLSAYLAMIIPLLPAYVVAGIGAVEFATSWIFWAICIPLLTIWTFLFYSIFDCSRSKSIELHSYNKSLVIRGFIYPKGFFDILPKKQVTLQYSDICHTMSSYSRGGTYFTIFTHDSKFRFVEHFDRADELFTVLTSIANKNDHPESESEKTYNSMMRVYWIVFGVFFLLALLSGVIAIFA